ncbi:MAG: hypothetical protein EOO16_01480 [Chitinophagaceae bacterium]|nr:MAG: hypothetical protein EOO16_01480 [Chitinophagaceae bacterium]
MFCSPSQTAPFLEPFWRSWRRLNRFRIAVPAISIVFFLLLLWAPGVQRFFKLGPLSGTELGIACATSVLSVLWVELWKANRWPAPGTTSHKRLRRYL